MRKRKKEEAALTTLLATAIGIASQGCYMDPPVVYVRVDDPRYAEGPVERIKQREILPPQRTDWQPTSEECHVYAQSYEDSVRSNPNRRMTRICTEHNPDLPRDLQHQTTEVSDFTVRTGTPAAPPVDVYELDRVLGRSALDRKKHGRVWFYTSESRNMLNITYFVLNKQGADYMILCHFTGFEKQPETVTGTCVLDGSGRNLNGRVDAMYEGPFIKGKKNIPKCLMKRSKKGDLKDCVPFKPNSSNYAQQQYRNISQRALYYGRRK